LSGDRETVIVGWGAARGVGDRFPLAPDDPESKDAPLGLIGGDKVSDVLPSLAALWGGRGESLRDLEGVK
jgi:hypothetical protein